MESATQYPDCIALASREERITYLELLTRVQRRATTLQAYGMKAGQHVAISLPRSIDYVVSYFAATYLGGVIVPLDPRLTHREAEAVLDFCDADLIITDQHSWAGSQRKSLVITCLDHAGEVIATSIGPHRPSPSSLAILLHTSGTTDEPKRVMLSHENLIRNFTAHSESLNLTHEDKVLIALPMHFGYCNTAQMLTHIALGGELVLMPEGFSARHFAQLVEKEGITSFTAVPFMLHHIATYRHLRQFDLKTLRYIIYGGGPMSRERLMDLGNALPHTELVQTYGQTEASPRITTMRHALRNPDSVGKPIMGVAVHIRDETGLVLPPNTIGEITVAGPSVMLGYYRNEALTERTIREGVLYTGDIGYLDTNGYLYITGRKGNMIIRAGMNIHAEEIEGYLLQHPNVQAVSVVGAEHAIQGEVPIAYVVGNVSLTEQELLQYCKEGLATYKIPTQFVFCDQLPYTYNYKIRRFKLIEDSKLTLTGC